ncbi:YrhB domain-containing protein [Burkholderia paludis]|uniref:YrhB domain-containing protein n=1 Tax=Burkholderia paludis TaxID=1506587 RepID=UPI0005BA68A3|nr:YrhB domain-containing protein [Burkholderia paludis]
MELTAEQAKEVAQRAITKAGWEGSDAVVVDKYTQEFDVGWVFYYQSARFLETGEFGFSLVGNAPIFVGRVGGYSAFISYLRPVVESIEAFRACGNANA